MKKIIVLLNAAAGATSAEEVAQDEARVRAAFGAAGLAIEIKSVEGSRLTETARSISEQHAEQMVIVAAGGDGTQSAVAAALAGTPTLMGVLPMGTLNHFAKDLGVPLEIDAAARVIVNGRPRAIDVGQVNERVFINNSSIGLYPHVVRHRDDMRQRLGHGKWYAMFRAILTIFRRFPVIELRMVVNGQEWRRTTPFVFVGNNQYQIDRLNLGQRSNLEQGDLCVYFANRTGRLGMLRLTLRALLGHLRQDKDFNALCATELWIETRKSAISVAADGEVHRLKPPLHYRTRPRALNVILPANDQ
jgi:diacylglycerol kinase family enzyme